ncbi:MAG: response regulator [Chloroflexota bacterium]|nr:response regulator [Chloroflexota bacterium]
MKKVLIVDDEVEIVELMQMLFEDDLEVLAAYDGQEALDVIAEHHPDLVVSDVMMPRLDGREFCRRVKTDPATSDIRVIMMSAVYNLDPQTCPADEIIRKPFDIHSVTEIVNRYLDMP